MSEWQPIATLKIDGYYLVSDGIRVVPVYAWPQAMLGYDDLTRWDYSGYEELDFLPTHWMPLPEPPK